MYCDDKGTKTVFVDLMWPRNAFILESSLRNTLKIFVYYAAKGQTKIKRGQYYVNIIQKYEINLLVNRDI